MNSRSFFFFLLLSFFLDSSVVLSQKVADHKVQTAMEVFNNLKAAKGIYPHEKPFLKVVKVLQHAGNLSLAYIEYATSEIQLEEKVYDICVADLKKDSLSGLSFILGHEIAHFLNHDTDVSHHSSELNQSILKDSTFLSIITEHVPNMDNSLIHTIQSSINKYKNKQAEALADLTGGFMTYLAGYRSPRKNPSITDIFLDSVYSKYGLSSRSDTYPSLFERKIIASSANRALDSLISVFEMANYLSAIEEFEDALTYYEKVASTFQSREIFNNMGTVALLGASRCFLPQELPANLPITLDLETKMDGGKNLIKGFTEEIRHDKLNKAIKYFQKSIYYDDQYPIAYLNLSIAHTLYAISFRNSKNTEIDSLQKIALSEEHLILAKAAIISAKTASLAQKEKEMAGQELVVLRTNLTNKDQGLSNIYIQAALVSKLQMDHASAEANRQKAMEANPENVFLATEEISDLGRTNEILCMKNEESLPGEDIFATFGKLANKWQTLDTIFQAQMKYFTGIQTLKTYKDENYDAYLNYSHLVLPYTTETLIVFPKKVDKTICNIGKGTAADVLTQTYGPPSRLISTNNGSFFVYVKLKNESSTGTLQRGIVFQLDSKGLVDKWFTFAKSSSQFH